MIELGLESKEVYNSLGVSYKGLNDDDNASKMLLLPLKELYSKQFYK